METCRLTDLIQAASELVAAAADAQGVRITLNCLAEVELPLERARVERLFINLMTNALEAMPGGGELHVSSWRAEQDAFIRVDDTGPGISSGVRGKLFQPFVSEGKRNGLGLGLALSRQTAIDHGGDLWVEEKEECGARFCVRLPIRLAVAETRENAGSLRW